IFLQGAGQTKQGEAFTYGYSVVPYEITHNVDLTTPVPVTGVQSDADSRFAPRRQVLIPQSAGPNPLWLTLLSALFMHGGLAHIGFNMLFLWVFGDNIEDNFGHLKFLVFYVLCGLAASFAQIAVSPDSIIPNLGASGAIAGVLGAYIVMFPHNRVRVLVPLWIIFTTIEVPALVALGICILTQVI